jgi:HPt (histidine-containing phosphotransfer) domain-containing protein
MGETDPIDYAVLAGVLDSVGGDREFLAELIETYLDDSPRLLEAMHMALETGNAEDFRRAAHSLKSNSASLGAMPLSRLARGLEEMGKAGMLEGAAANLAQAEAEYALVKAAMQDAGA